MSKKLTKEEQKAQDDLKAMEEKQRLEELEKQQEEQKRYQVITLSTGLQLQITQKILEDTWDNQDPKKNIRQYLNILFENNNWKMDDILQQILIDYFIYNLIFAQNQLKLDYYKTTILLNIQWHIFKNNNARLNQDGQKTFKNDFELMTKTLLNHSINQPPQQIKIFDKQQVIQIVNYMKLGYFNHYKLFNHVQQSVQSQEDTEIIVYVDSPMQILPLSQAHFIGEKLNSNDDNVQKQYQQDTQRQVVEQLDNEEQDDQDNLDPEIMQLVRQKIEEQKVKLQNELEQRQVVLEEKLNHAKAQGHKGKKK